MISAENIVSVRPARDIDLGHGTVKGGGQGHYLVDGAEGVLNASTAFSCLVRPEPGDHVLYARDALNACVILAITARPGAGDATLAFARNVTLSADNGEVTVSGSGGVTLASDESASIAARSVDVMADKCVVGTGELTVMASQCDGYLKRVKLFADSVDTVAERLTQRLKHSFRLIEGVDQTRAGELLTTVKNLFSLRSRQAVVLARQDIKMDAERIHMG